MASAKVKTSLVLFASVPCLQRLITVCLHHSILMSLNEAADFSWALYTGACFMATK